MTATVARVMLAPVVMLATVALYVPVYVVLEHDLDYDVARFISVLLCAGFLVVAWLFVWRREVVWTPKRMLLTLASVPGAVVPAALVYLMMAWVAQFYPEVSIIVGGIVWAATWLVSTAGIWCETASERRDRLARPGIGVIACPTCGYDLTGLREARCPECGSQFTLDQLYAAVAEAQRDLGDQ